MKAKRRLRFLAPAIALVLVGLVVLIRCRHVQLYRVTVLPSFGGKTIFPDAVNDRGQVVGVAEDAAGRTHSFLWDPAKGMQELDLHPISVPTNLHLNNAGQVVGTDCDPNAPSFMQPFFCDFENGKEQLVTLSLDLSGASDLNNRGQVVGDSGSEAFIWDKTNGMRSLGTPEGYLLSRAEAVNDAGQVMGTLVWEEPSKDPVSCYWHSTDPASTPMMPLLAPKDFPGGVDINNNGYVLGRKQRSDKARYWTFLWRKDAEIEWLFPLEHPQDPLILNDPNQVLYREEHRSSLERLSKNYFGPYTQNCLWDPKRGKTVLDNQVPREVGNLLRVVDINNHGCIVGVIRSKDSRQQTAVLLEPIPERWRD